MVWPLLSFSPSPCGEGVTSLALESERAVCSQAICSGVNGGVWDDIVVEEAALDWHLSRICSLIGGLTNRGAQTRSWSRLVPIH